MDGNEKINAEQQTEGAKREIKGIRTYAKDLGESMIDQKGGVIKTAIEEQEDKAVEQKNISLASSKNRLFLIGSAALFVAAVSTIIFLAATNKPETITPQKEVPAIISYDYAKGIDITNLEKEKISEAIKKEVSSAFIPSDKIEYIFLTKNTAGSISLANSKVFLSAIQSRAPAILLNALTNDIMIGAYSSSGNHPFILIKTGNPLSYSDARLGLSEWESRMFDDLYIMFSINTENRNQDLFNKKFEDGILKNKSARVLKDDAGRIVLLYSFINDQTIAITTGQEALEELSNRLNAQKVQQQ